LKQRILWTEIIALKFCLTFKGKLKESQTDSFLRQRNVSKSYH